jgi:hypothetical protein
MAGVLITMMAKLHLAQAAMGKRGTRVGELCKELGVTRQTLYRFVDPKGELRADGRKLLERRRSLALTEPCLLASRG